MASHRVSRFVKAGAAMLLASAPVVSSKVFAASTLDTEARKIKVTELPLYDNPDKGVDYQYVEEDINLVRRGVSRVRQVIWNFKDSFQDTIDTVVNKYETGKAHTQDTLDYIQNDRGVLPRVGVITVAALGGVIAGYRGGMFRKVLYSTVSLTAAAAVCYPEEAIGITMEAYKTVWTSVKPLIFPEADSSSDKEAAQCAAVDPVLPVTPKAEPVHIVAEQTEAVKPIKGDPGQSCEEDKDLYTTRTS